MVIGFRANTNGFSYVVLDGTQSSINIIGKDKVNLPKNSEWPESLSWIRKQVAELFQKYEILGVCIKTIEPNAKRPSSKRYQVEAIIQEYCNTSHSLISNTRIKSQLKRDIENIDKPARYFERIFKNNEQLSQLDNPNFQEAALAAISELPID